MFLGNLPNKDRCFQRFFYIKLVTNNYFETVIIFKPRVKFHLTLLKSKNASCNGLS